MPDRLDLVAAGHRRAAIVNTHTPQEVLERAREAGVAAVAGNELGEDSLGRLAEGNAGTQIYLAPKVEDAERLAALDLAVRNTASPEAPRETHALGAALGYPDCCAWTYPHTAFERTGEGEDVRWVRNFLWRAGPGRYGPWSPWLNFHAARVFGLEFFEHLPCCPWCRPTTERNRNLVGRLYDPADAACVREALSQSVILWPDGRFLPFLCTGREGEVLEVAEVGVTRGEVRPHFADRVRREIPGLPGGVDGLRQGRKGWELRARGRWQKLDPGDGGQAIVCAFSLL